ncbi:MAG: hypothetical protein NXI26_22620 [bacterium]|nr:hypothetical protein [bacterium]
MKKQHYPNQRKLFELLEKLYSLQNKHFPKHYMESAGLSKTPVYYRVNGRSSITFDEGCRLLSSHNISMDHGYINSDTDSSLKLLEEIFQHIEKDDEIEMTIICSSLPPFLFHTKPLQAFEQYFQQLTLKNTSLEQVPFTSFSFDASHFDLLGSPAISSAKKTLVLPLQLFEKVVHKIHHVDALGLFQNQNIKKRLLNSLLSAVKELKNYITHSKHQVVAFENPYFELSNLILIQTQSLGLAYTWSDMMSKVYLLTDDDSNNIKRSFTTITPHLHNIFPYNSKGFRRYFETQKNRLEAWQT